MACRFSGGCSAVWFQISKFMSKVQKRRLNIGDCSSAAITVQQADTVRGWTGRGAQRRWSGPELLTLVQHRVSVKQRQKKYKQRGEKIEGEERQHTGKSSSDKNKQTATTEEKRDRRWRQTDRSRDEASCCPGSCVPGIQLTPQMA